VYADQSPLLAALQPFDFGVLFGLAALGAWLTAGSWRRIWFLYAMLAAYALSVTLFYVFARYRFPVALVLMLLAAGGLLRAYDLAKLRQFRKLAAPAAAALAAIAIARLPVENPHRYAATQYLSMAIALSNDPAQAGQATALYRRALDAAPNFPSAEMGLGAILSRLGRQEEAIPHFREALAQSPDFAEARYDLALALAASGRPREAAQEYETALRLRPDDPDLNIAYGKTLTVLDRPAGAVERFHRGLAQHPNDVRGLVGLGAALTRLGRLDEAVAEFRLALELDPDNPEAHNDLGWSLASAGHIGEAVPHFERALEIDPGYANARENLEQARTILARSTKQVH
jgi:Flp pilus assembly protein TadD